MSQKYRYRTLARDPAIKSLFMCEMTSNIHFVFDLKNEQNVRIPAHKNVLTARSSVFNAMFFDPLKDPDNIKIVDATPTSFWQFLQFFYLTEVELTTESIEDVMKMGEKYDVVICQKVCDQFLMDQLADENVCWIYELAIKFKRIEVKKLCEIFIGINTSSVFESTGFINCTKLVLTEILQLDSLECSEYDVFKACIGWIRKASKKNYLTTDKVRSVLGDSLNVIRFEIMRMDEFLSIFHMFELLFTAEKRGDIIKTITAKEFLQIKNPNGRTCIWMNKPIIDCERDFQVTKTPYYIQKTESTSFSTNKPTILKGIICSNIHILNGPSFIKVYDDISCEIEIFEFRNSVNGKYAYCDDEAELEYNEDDREFNIWLEKPIIILPEKKYEIRLKLVVTDGLCTNITLTSDKKPLNREILVTFHDSSKKKTTTSNGHSSLITGLKFSII